MNGTHTSPFTGNGLHDQITVLARQHVSPQQSTLRGDISGHTVASSTVSFQALGRFLDAVKALNKTFADKVFVGSIDSKLHVSVAPALHIDDNVPAPKGKKRGRNDTDERADYVKALVTPRIEELRKTGASSVSPETFDLAAMTVQRLLYNLKGPKGQQLIESWTVSTVGACCPAPQWCPAPMNSVILGVRFAPGLPVPVALLRRALGACFHDGIFTVTRPLSAADTETLPLSDQGLVTERAGHWSMRMFAQICAAPRPAPR